MKVAFLLFLACCSFGSPALAGFVVLGDGTKMHYEEAGTGETILLLHGFAASSSSWSAAIPALAHGHHVLAPDMPGFGFSDKPDVEYGNDLFVAATHEFLEKMGIARAILVGNSMGGGIAVQYVRKYPEQVSRLVLIDTAGVAEGFNTYQTLFKLIFNPLTEILPPNRTMVGLILKDVLYHDAGKVTASQIDQYYRPYTTAGAMRAATKTMDSFSGHFPESDFTGIGVPTLILWGANDRIFPVDTSETLLRLIPHSKREILSECGHTPQEEQPTGFLESLTRFLDSDTK